MVSTRYQVTRFGSGFLGPGQPTVDEAMELAREKLSKIDGQYHFRGDDEHRLGRPEILRTLEERVSAGAIGEKFVVMGSNYDQPGVAVRIIRDSRRRSAWQTTPGRQARRPTWVVTTRRSQSGERRGRRRFRHLLGGTTPRTTARFFGSVSLLG